MSPSSFLTPVASFGSRSLDRAPEVEQRGRRPCRPRSAVRCCIARTGDCEQPVRRVGRGADVVVAHRAHVAGLGREVGRVDVEREDRVDVLVDLGVERGQWRPGRPAPCRRPSRARRRRPAPAASASARTWPAESGRARWRSSWFSSSSAAAPGAERGRRATSAYRRVRSRSSPAIRSRIARKQRAGSRRPAGSRRRAGWPARPAPTTPSRRSRRR